MAPAGNDASPRAASRLPDGLEQRVAALEAAPGRNADFDAVSWAWLVLLGVVLPAALIVAGWWL